mmetsp:Transcript_22269/g.26766  ORF Transcript_22269/g.26766 Transcript_22269/m.26766 type:complete len:611 (-) Transcript_22269:165-1997(-)|eukprot:CAMPEP_0197858612 /NCGR_PEP_ID=MMETSP1438-20131217/32519_1 /TAXON_ID=1461541 /ORGANISM="Pterosperma sp., Strain CCMP1384" /LENGTH=610 /DNA_ID=CAMNT_0043474825 /DNA_START=166 /DNA_END=1998 /DNA_ORIENTATION=-
MVEFAGYKLNCETALNKNYEGMSFSQIAFLPHSALEGIGEKGGKALQQIGLHTVSDLGNWSIFKRARAIATLAETEGVNGRVEGSIMNVDMLVKKKHCKHLLSELADAPPSSLLGVSAKVEGLLAELHIKSISELATCKYMRWAEAIVTVASTEADSNARAPSVEDMSALPPVPSTPTREPPVSAAPGSAREIQKPLTPTALEALKVQDYKEYLESLNERLQYYISLIRQKEDTIGELQDQLTESKLQYSKDVNQLDTHYRSELEKVQTAMMKDEDSRMSRLEGSLATAKNDLARAKDALVSKEKECLKLSKSLDSSAAELKMTKSQLDGTKKDLNEKLAELSKIEDDMADLEKKSNQLSKDNMVLKQESNGLRTRVDHFDSLKKIAVDDVTGKMEAKRRKAEEALQAKHFADVEAQKAELEATWKAKMQEFEERMITTKEKLENELLRVSGSCSEAETYAQESASELESLRAEHKALRDRHVAQGVELKKQIAALQHQLAITRSSKDVVDSELNDIVRHAGSMVEGIQQYNDLLAGEETRLGIMPGTASAGSKGASGSARKRRRHSGDGDDMPTPNAALDFQSPAGATEEDHSEGLLGSAKKAMRSFLG